MDSFNPYFSGCFSLREYVEIAGEMFQVGFQSLFFWMLLSKESIGDFRELLGERFNPYFSGCFSLRGQTAPIAVSQTSQSFNPYFSGCFSLSKLILFLYIRDILYVSILIFLDASL